MPPCPVCLELTAAALVAPLPFPGGGNGSVHAATLTELGLRGQTCGSCHLLHAAITAQAGPRDAGGPVILSGTPIRKVAGQDLPDPTALSGVIASCNGRSATLNLCATTVPK